MKRVFAILCAVLVLACAVVPCFASNWSEETPEYGGAYIGAYENFPFSSTRLQTQEAVNKAWKLGMFGGARPVMILYYFGASGAYNVFVVTPRPTDRAGFGADGLPKADSYYAGLAISGSLAEVTCSLPSGVAPFVVYQLMSNGDWGVYETRNAGEFIRLISGAPGASGVSGYKQVCYVRRNGENELAFAKPSTSGIEPFITGWDESSTPTDRVLSSIITRYDNALAGESEGEDVPEIPVTPILLDVPSIFDGMFNGLRSVLGAFDLEIFGISVVGMLVAFIVIAVVAFIVRKLWK